MLRRSPRKAIRRCPPGDRCRTASAAPIALVVSTESTGRLRAWPVHAHDRGARAQLGGQVGLVVAGRREHQPVGVPGAELPGQRPLPVRVLVEAGREHHHPARRGLVLDRPLHRGRERVADVLEQQPDRCRPAIGAAQDAGAGVRPEVELLDRPPDPPLEDGRYPASLVDHPGDGLEADPGPLRDVAHGRPAPARRGLPQWAHRPPSTGRRLRRLRVRRDGEAAGPTLSRTPSSVTHSLSNSLALRPCQDA